MGAAASMLPRGSRGSRSWSEGRALRWDVALADLQKVCATARGQMMANRSKLQVRRSGLVKAAEEESGGAVRFQSRPQGGRWRTEDSG